MKITETSLKGTYLIEIEPIEDERGFFSRSFCQNELSSYGLETTIVQCNLSYNKQKGTLRGMHFQIEPFAEAKYVSCIQGALYDVIIDLRPDSRTYGQWLSVTLEAEKHHILYIPKGFAHGFQTLKDETTVYYQMSENYHPEASRAIRWNDDYFNIQWPNLDSLVLSEKDRAYPDFIPKKVVRTL